MLELNFEGSPRVFLQNKENVYLEAERYDTMHFIHRLQAVHGWILGISFLVER